MTKFTFDKLQVCTHQVGGHFGSGKSAATFVDEEGKFYKAFQDDLRGGREAQIYGRVFGDDSEEDEQTVKDFVAFRQFIPKCYGIVESGDTKLLVLEDSCAGYRKPCVLDAKMGFTTIYEWSNEAYKRKNFNKDLQTTQSSLGYRITGFKTFDRAAGAYFFADRDYGKKLSPETIRTDCWVRFAANGSLRPSDLYGGATGAIAQIQALSAWFAAQRSLQFFAASILIIYEGDATNAEEANVKVRLIDFAHTFSSKGKPDDNVGKAIESLLAELNGVCADDASL